jgi:hypothetical protein
MSTIIQKFEVSNYRKQATIVAKYTKKSDLQQRELALEGMFLAKPLQGHAN